MLGSAIACTARSLGIPGCLWWAPLVEPSRALRRGRAQQRPFPISGLFRRPSARLGRCQVSRCGCNGRRHPEGTLRIRIRESRDSVGAHALRDLEHLVEVPLEFRGRLHDPSHERLRVAVTSRGFRPWRVLLKPELVQLAVRTERVLSPRPFSDQSRRSEFPLALKVPDDVEVVGPRRLIEESVPLVGRLSSGGIVRLLHRFVVGVELGDADVGPVAVPIDGEEVRVQTKVAASSSRM